MGAAAASCAGTGLESGMRRERAASAILATFFWTAWYDAGQFSLAVLVDITPKFLRPPPLVKTRCFYRHFQ